MELSNRSIRPGECFRRRKFSSGGAAKNAANLKQSNVDVHEPQAGNGAAKIRSLPEVDQGLAEGAEVVEIPQLGRPGENHQEKSDFESKNGKGDVEEAALPTLAVRNLSGGGGFDGGGRGKLGFLIGIQGHGNNSLCSGTGLSNG